MNQPIVYHVRHAGLHDLDACLELRIRAEEALAAAGITQWHDRAHGRQVISGWIHQGAMHVVTTPGGEVMACFALAGADPAFWTPAEAAQPALYMYKFIIRRDRLGSGLGELVLDWCSRRAADCGARWLRLDCWRTNIALHNYWLARGFRLLDIREHPVRNSGALFERDAGTLLAAAELRDQITLVDHTLSALTAAVPTHATVDGYDAPPDVAAVWTEAAALVDGMKLAQPPSHPDAWNAALQRAAHALAQRSHTARHAAGMNHRVITTS